MSRDECGIKHDVCDIRYCPKQRPKNYSTQLYDEDKS